MYGHGFRQMNDDLVVRIIIILACFCGFYMQLTKNIVTTYNTVFFTRSTVQALMKWTKKFQLKWEYLFLFWLPKSWLLSSTRRRRNWTWFIFRNKPSKPRIKIPLIMKVWQCISLLTSASSLLWFLLASAMGKKFWFPQHRNSLF